MNLNETDDQAPYDISQLAFARVAEPSSVGRWHFVWAHGWGQNRAAMQPLAQSLFTLGTHDFLDFPGFGASPRPAAAWSTADYADAVARWLTANSTGQPVVWIGHSFGGRVGIQLAARHPTRIDRMLLLSAAGLPRRRSPLAQAKLKSRIYAYKALKQLAPFAGLDRDRLRDRFASADYKAAGALADIFLNVVREDLSAIAARITCPVHLVYGAADSETPPEIGTRLNRLIAGSELTILPGQDHYSVLGEGRHQVAKQLKSLLER